MLSPSWVRAAAGTRALYRSNLSRSLCTASSPGPLHGLRVLEMGSFIAGPACGTLLGSFGAEVIKIEPASGDQIRTWREVVISPLYRVQPIGFHQSHSHVYSPSLNDPCTHCLSQPTTSSHCLALTLSRSISHTVSLYISHYLALYRTPMRMTGGRHRVRLLVEISRPK